MAPGLRAFAHTGIRWGGTMNERQFLTQTNTDTRAQAGQPLPRQGMRSRFCAALEELCRKEPVREKWLIAPSLRIGHQWLDIVALQGQPVLNCRVKTLKGVVLELAGPEMAHKGVSLVSVTGSLILMDSILHRLPLHGYLSSLPRSPGLARVVLSSIDALRMADIVPDSLDPSCFDEPSKADDMKFLLGTYLDALGQRRLVDYAEVLRMARSSLGERGMGRAIMLLPEDVDLTALEREFMNAVPGAAVLWLPVDQPAIGKDNAREDETDASLLRWLSAATEVPGPRNDGTATVFHAIGEINEVREALRRCLAQGYALDEVELLHTDRQTYVPLIFETFLRMNPQDQDPDAPVPVTFAEGIPATYAKPGHALAGWIQWIKEDYTQHTLARMIEDGLLDIPGAHEQGVSWHRLARVLREVKIGWNKHRYAEKISERILALEKKNPKDTRIEHEASADDEDSHAASSRLSDETRIVCLRVIRDLVERVLATAPLEGTSPVDTLHAAARFVSSLSRADSEMDNYAARSLVEHIQDMARWLAAVHGPVSLDVWEWLAGLPSAVSIMGSGPRPGRLHVANISSGGFSGRPHACIIGLDDGRFPGTALNDPVLLDTEREKLSENLPTAREQLGRHVERFVRLLARLRGTITLGYASLDLRTDRALFPSPAVFSAFRILSGNRNGDQTDLMKWLSLPASFAPAEESLHLDETEWWLWRLCGRERVRDPFEVLDRRYPHLARGRLAIEQRQSAGFTVYDGRIPELPSDLDPFAQNGPTMSSAMLETIGACALRYFFKYVLEIRPSEELLLDPTRWLDPVEFGNLLHDVFYRFISELIGQRRLPLFERDMARLAAILEDYTDRYAQIHSPPGPSVFRRQHMQLLQSARIFLKEEEILCRTRTPRFVEVSVGMTPRGNAGPIDTREPVTVSVDKERSIRVRGRIDRIDSIGEDSQARFAVCDYKTGSDFRYTKQDPFWEGRVIQHALYLAIAANVLTRKVARNAKVIHFEYYFPQHRGRGRRISLTPEQVGLGNRVIERLCSVVHEGSFLPTINDRDDCTMCDYLSVCGDVQSTAAWARVKIHNPENTQLEPLRELRNCGDIET